MSSTLKITFFALLKVLTTCMAQNAAQPPSSSICLRQADFDAGTKIISKSGVYKLCENISFGPNGPAVDGELPSETSFDPIFPSELYSENAFGLGFFSALSIVTSDVKLFLNGFTIEQSAEHALMQRFFAVIELASSPFIKSAGPAQFVGDGELFAPASNIQIIGPGTIGRSSHHGIHGNDNNHITIHNVQFRDFEVAAVALNNVDSVEISDCSVIQNRHDVPVLGLFSAARFLRPYAKALKDIGYSMRIRGEELSAEVAYENLIASINNVYHDVIYGTGTIDENAHPEEFKLFHNPFGVIDGPCYAFVVHGKGPAVGDQGEIFDEADNTKTSSNVVIRNNDVNNIQCWNNEVPAATDDTILGSGHGPVMNDARGAVFQFISNFQEEPYLAIDADGKYKGNVVADMQIMVAQAILDGTLKSFPERQTAVNSINANLIAWAQEPTAIYEPMYRCNGDSMHHVIKGIIVFRIEDTAGFSIIGNSIQNVENLSVAPFTDCHDFHAGASHENLNEHQAGNVRGISVAAVRGYSMRRSEIKNNNIFNIRSEHANAICGIDVQGDSKDTVIMGNFVNLDENVGDDTNDKYMGLRVREGADGSGNDAIQVKNNFFAQGSEILNVMGVRRRELSLMKLHGHKSGDIEWVTGGCPFANMPRT